MLGANYHISKNGEAGICKAKGRCPLGGDSGTENHFDSENEAQVHADKINERKYGLFNTMSNKQLSDEEEYLKLKKEELKKTEEQEAFAERDSVKRNELLGSKGTYIEIEYEDGNKSFNGKVDEIYDDGDKPGLVIEGQNGEFRHIKLDRITSFRQSVSSGELYGSLDKEVSVGYENDTKQYEGKVVKVFDDGENPGLIIEGEHGDHKHLKFDRITSFKAEDIEANSNTDDKNSQDTISKSQLNNHDKSPLVDGVNEEEKEELLNSEGKDIYVKYENGTKVFNGKVDHVFDDGENPGVVINHDYEEHKHIKFDRISSFQTINSDEGPKDFENPTYEDIKYRLKHFEDAIDKHEIGNDPNKRIKPEQAKMMLQEMPSGYVGYAHMKMVNKYGFRPELRKNASKESRIEQMTNEAYYSKEIIDDVTSTLDNNEIQEYISRAEKKFYKKNNKK